MTRRCRPDAASDVWQYAPPGAADAAQIRIEEIVMRKMLSPSHPPTRRFVPPGRTAIRRTCRVLACALWATFAALVVSACGGSGHAGSATKTGATPVASAYSGPEPNAVVVRVGGHAITRAQFAHSLAGVEKFEGLGSAAPVPPDFTACTKHLASTPPTPGGAKPSAAAAKKSCEVEYQKLLKHALDPLISRQWVIGGAAEAGVSVSEAEVQAQLKAMEKHSSRAQMVANLAGYGSTFAEFEAQTKVNLLAEGIRHMIRAKANAITTADVASYYAANKGAFGTPPRRALYIVRTATEAEALKVKREIAAGRSFASIAKHLPLQQPIFTNDAYLAGYEPKLYTEPPLNNAILAAKPNVLSGPVKIFLGYYVFEVKRLIPATVEPLAQAYATIRAELPYKRYRAGLRAFVAAWRARWRARTQCQPGYVVAKCAGVPPEAEDPFTLG